MPDVSKYDDRGRPVRRQVAAPSGGRVLTKQDQMMPMRELVNRWIKTGTVTVPSSAPMYGDFSSGLDFQQALEAVQQGQAQFDALPSRVRELCRNDPGVFLDSIMDPEKREVLVAQGLDPELMTKRAQDARSKEIEEDAAAERARRGAQRRKVAKAAEDAAEAVRNSPLKGGEDS